MRFLFALILSLAFVVPVSAAPEKPQAKQSQLDKWFGELAKAETEEDAEAVRKKIYAVFTQSGSASIDLLMARATAAFANQDAGLARRLIDSVTRIAPNFAEGWRQRAALQSASGDDRGAMVSLHKAIALNPRHFAAMMELAGLLESYGDKAGALKLTRQALKLDPHMDGAEHRERALKKDVEGQDI